MQNFDLVLCINGTTLNKKQINLIKVPVKFINCDLPMNKARVFALKKIMNFYETITLLDSDDIMDLNRLKLVQKNMRNKDFLVNNLYTFTSLNKKPKKWIKFKDNKKIRLDDIFDSNFIGLSNLTIKSKALKKIIDKINTKLVALDWCIAKLLLIINAKGVYKSKIITFYRQHPNNVSNLNNFKKKQILKDIKNKIEHFKFFKRFKIYNSYEIESLKKKFIKVKNNKDKNLKGIIKNNKKAWWSHV